jgi:hypothetical protein
MDEQLAADFTSCMAPMSLSSLRRTFKVKHSDSVVCIHGHNLFQRDRARRRGGGVALYIRSTIQANVWNFPADDRMFEPLWVKVANGMIFGALYHVPKPIYKPSALVDFIEACVEEINREYPSAQIVLAGDLNQLPD